MFQNNCLSFLNPSNQNIEKSSIPEETFLEMVKDALKSYNEIEELRLNIVDEI